MSKEHLPQDVIKRVKDVAKILDVVIDAGIEMKPVGANYKALCPFHADKNPSLIISPGRNTYKCFACGEGGDSIKFVMSKYSLSFVDAVKYLAKMYGIDTNDYLDSVPVKRTNYVAKTEPLSQTDFYEFEQVGNMQEWNGKSRLSHLSCFLIDSGFAKDIIKGAMSWYHVGVDSDGNTWFWQIDNDGNAHTAHIIPYDPKTGRRLKKGDPRLHGLETWWAQDVEYWQNTKGKSDEEKSHIRKRYVTQCLFGEHLLNVHTDNAICIVESEKTGLIMSMIDRDKKTWIATGGKGNLSVEKLKALRGRYVILYPDVDAYYEWEQKLSDIKSKLYDEYKIRLTIRDVGTKVKEFLKVDVIPDWARKFDIADLELFKRGVWRP